MPYCRQANIWPKANIYLWHKATYAVAMTQDTPSRSLDKVIVRLPDGMRDRIREAAEKNNRSMNAEIVSRLDNSFMQEFWDAKAPLQLAKERSLQEDAIQKIIEQTVLQLSDVLGLDKSKLNLKK